MSKMKFVRLFMLIVLMMSVITSSAFAKWRYEQTILIHNYTNLNINHVYVSVYNSPNMGDDVLKEVIKPGNSLKLNHVIISDVAVFRVKIAVYFENGTKVYKYDVDVNKDFEWTLK